MYQQFVDVKAAALARLQATFKWQSSVPTSLRYMLVELIVQDPVLSHALACKHSFILTHANWYPQKKGGQEEAKPPTVAVRICVREKNGSDYIYGACGEEVSMRHVTNIAILVYSEKWLSHVAHVRALTYVFWAMSYSPVMLISIIVRHLRAKHPVHKVCIYRLAHTRPLCTYIHTHTYVYSCRVAYAHACGYISTFHVCMHTLQIQAFMYLCVHAHAHTRLSFFSLSLSLFLSCGCPLPHQSFVMSTIK